jgi:hypothetical protein
MAGGARAGIEGLNARLGEGRGDRFFLLHRARQWNPGEAVWMGWERKRGKLEELNRLLRGATDTSYDVQVGDTAVLRGVRYCITLDSVTRLPRDGARKLVGIAAHPLNRPRLDPRAGRVGWTWYTGAAGWRYRAGVESILGLRRHGATFEVDPCIPSSWPGFELRWRVGGTRYEITVTNPERRCRGVAGAQVDGVAVDPRAIPLVDDGGAHDVRVVLGAAAAATSGSPGRAR